MSTPSVWAGRCPLGAGYCTTLGGRPGGGGLSSVEAGLALGVGPAWLRPPVAGSTPYERDINNE